MDKPKLTLREIIFEGIKKFAGEIIGVVLLASFLWLFPSFRSLFTDHTFPKKDEPQTEIQSELELHQQEEALRETEAKKTEEVRQIAEKPKATAENTEPIETPTIPLKADTGGIIRAQQDEHAKEVTTQAKQKSGAELLREVLEKYGPEDFFSASLNPKIFHDEKTKKPYIQVTEKFNQSVFWDKFLPELRKALDGVAAKKTKQFYVDKVRNANQTLNKQGYFERIRTPEYGLAYPYEFNAKKLNAKGYSVVVPDDVASFTAYDMPFGAFGGVKDHNIVSRIANADDEYFNEVQLRAFEPELRGTGLTLLYFIRKMSKPFAYSITYLDKDGDVISVQVIRKKHGMFTVYRAFDYGRFAGYNTYILSGLAMSLAPGFMHEHKMRKRNDITESFLAIDTGNYNLAHPEEGYTIELNKEELQRLDTMKFEVIFEQ
ncbi:MAG: hypothetical protein IJQ70_05415 [Synergistaceae bacterium]|nr:hypothetical protein [Synergistaceae bacterium]